MTRTEEWFQGRRSVLFELSFALLTALLLWCIEWFLWGLQTPVGDGPMYVAMAQGAAGTPPWSFHILAPRLASLLFPNDPALGFFWIAAFSFVGTAGIVDLLIRKIGFETMQRERLLAVALFMVTCTGAFMFRAYFLTDSLSYFLLAIACVGTLYHRDGIVAIVTTIGILNRETAFFVVPVWFFFNFRGTDLQTLVRRSLFIFFPAVLVYFLLHFTSVFLGYDPASLNSGELDSVAALWHSNLSWLGTENIYFGLALCVFLAYGPVWFLAVVGLVQFINQRDTKESRAGLALWMLVLPVLASLVVVDWRRGFQPLFPAIVCSATLGIRFMTGWGTRIWWYVLSIVTIAAAFGTTQAWWFPPMRVPITIAMSLWIGIIGIVILKVRRSHSIIIRR